MWTNNNPTNEFWIHKSHKYQTAKSIVLFLILCDRFTAAFSNADFVFYCEKLFWNELNYVYGIISKYCFWMCRGGNPFPRAVAWASLCFSVHLVVIFPSFHQFRKEIPIFIMFSEKKFQKKIFRKYVDLLLLTMRVNNNFPTISKL